VIYRWAIGSNCVECSRQSLHEYRGRHRWVFCYLLTSMTSATAAAATSMKGDTTERRYADSTGRAFAGSIPQ
jgi:hypothetical protein